MLLLLLVTAGMEGSRGDAPRAGQSGEGSQDLHSAADTQADSRGNGATAAVREWEDVGVVAPDLLSNLREPAFVKTSGSVFIRHNDRGRRWAPAACHTDVAPYP